MKSVITSRFNHDNQANTYDSNVANKTNPIRASYDKILNEIINIAKPGKDKKILEFGSGIGNLTSKISSCKSIVCVDISEKMEEKSKDKCKHLINKEFVKSDFLEFFENNTETFDLIISSYALHHLTKNEKIKLLNKCKNILNPNGKIIIGDLMLVNENELSNVKKKYADNKNVIFSMTDEFYWICDDIKNNLKSNFSNIETINISSLSSIMVFE